LRPQFHRRLRTKLGDGGPATLKRTLFDATEADPDGTNPSASAFAP
jgi:hypothetical protein